MADEGREAYSTERAVIHGLQTEFGILQSVESRERVYCKFQRFMHVNAIHVINFSFDIRGRYRETEGK